jgi:hypothetical protein|tara:strand:- start:1480 stop:1788 length:309 start_codon:yes stop_codon:yes gene_type:complete
MTTKKQTSSSLSKSKTKKVIDLELAGNGAWVLESILLRELYPIKDFGKTETYTQDKIIYQKKIASMNYNDLLVEFTERLGARYKFKNLTKEQQTYIKTKDNK